MFDTEKSYYVKNADQLAYCRVCHNRAFTSQKGTICALTNERPTFKETCETFRLDAEELEKKETKIRQQIYDHVHKYNIDPLLIDKMNEKLKWLFYNVENPSYKTVEKTHELSFKDKNRKDGDIGFSFALIIAVLFGFTFAESTLHTFIAIFALFVAIGYFVYSLISYFHYTHKIPLKTSVEGLYYKEKLYYWGDINDFCFFDFSKSNSPNKQVILGTISNGIIAVNLNDIQIKEAEIIEILNLNIKHHYKKLGEKRGEIVVSGE